MRLYWSKFKDEISGEVRNCQYEPLGLDGIKTKWQFSEDFPIGVNAEITTENLQFIKEDADYLRAQYIEFGEGACVLLLVRTFANQDFTFKVDFSSYEDSEGFVSVGLKATPLKDKIKAIEGETIDVGTMLSPMSAQTKIRTKNEGAGFEKPISLKITHNKIKMSVEGNVNDIYFPDTTAYGYALNQDLTAQQETLTDGTTDIYVDNIETNTSLISWLIKDNVQSYDVNVKISLTAKFRFGSTWNSTSNDIFTHVSNPQVGIRLIVANEYFFEDGTSSIVKQSSDTISESVVRASTAEVSFSRDLLLYSSLEYANYNQGSNACTKIFSHIYVVPIMLGQSTVPILASEYISPAFYCQITNCKITHDLVRIDTNGFQSVGVIPLFDYINRNYGETFRGHGELAELVNARLSTYNILQGKSTELTLKLSDIITSLSACYSLVFAENNGVYEVQRIEDYFSTAKETPLIIGDWYDKRLYNESTFDRVEIGTETTDETLRAEMPIFEKDTWKCNIPTLRKKEEPISINIPLDYSGDKIFAELVKGNASDDLVLIDRFANTSTTYQRGWVYPYQNQTWLQLNEGFSNKRILWRLKRWLFSFIPYNLPLYSELNLDYSSKIPQDSEYMSCRYPIPNGRIFKPYKVDVNIKFDWDFITALKNTPRAVKIGEKLYFPFNYEANIEPNTITLTCREYEE